MSSRSTSSDPLVGRWRRLSSYDDDYADIEIRRLAPANWNAENETLRFYAVKGNAFWRPEGQDHAHIGSLDFIALMQREGVLVDLRTLDETSIDEWRTDCDKISLTTLRLVIPTMLEVEEGGGYFSHGFNVTFAGMYGPENGEFITGD